MISWREASLVCRLATETEESTTNYPVFENDF